MQHRLHTLRKQWRESELVELISLNFWTLGQGLKRTTFIYDDLGWKERRNKGRNVKKSRETEKDNLRETRFRRRVLTVNIN